jgi:hypothetical protein
LLMIKNKNANILYRSDFCLATIMHFNDKLFVGLFLLMPVNDV